MEKPVTPRQRFNDVFDFRTPAGRLPLVEWAAWWDKTLDRFKREGLPPDIGYEDSLRHFGLDVMYCISANVIGPDCPSPIEWCGGIISDEAGYERIRPYILCDCSIDRLIEEALRLKERHDSGEIVIRLWLDGFFWFPRTLLGIGNHLYAFYDQPHLIHRINADLAEFHERTLSRLLDIITPDMAGFAEDMSFNHGPLLSEKLFNAFVRPYYLRLVPVLKRGGVKVLVDTDGFVEEMIPWLIGAGIEGVYPLERQAGVDIKRIRANHPRFLMLGGYDKMVMSKGEAEMRGEFERILPVMRSGGYVPSVDHQTPPEVSLANYEIYVRLLNEYAQKAARR